VKEDINLPTDLAALIRQHLRAVPDYPKPGIVYQDITPVLQQATLFRQVIEALAEQFETANVSHVIGIEARGFILGGAVASHLGAGFVPARKAGKLPWKTMSESYSLEYGEDSLEAHEDAFETGGRALIVDDVIATGGTAQATGSLARSLGAEVVGWAFLLEIAGLDGLAKLHGAPVHVLATV
jgi:adenine phosphoribosyltransferase